MACILNQGEFIPQSDGKTRIPGYVFFFNINENVLKVMTITVPQKSTRKIQP